MSRQYRSFDALEEDQHQTEVCAVHWTESGPSISGSLDGAISIWSTSFEGAYIGSVSPQSPHLGLRSISSSSKSGRVLSSDILGKVALWNVIEEDDQDEDMDQEIRRWKLEMVDSANAQTGGFTVNGANGAGVKQKATTCYVTQIHPTESIFAASGAWAGASIYACPNDESEEMKLGTPIRYISDYGQQSKRGTADKASGSFGRSLVFDPKGNKLAVGTDKGLVSLYDVESGATLTVVRNHPCPIRSIAFTQTGELLVGSDQCNITLYDLRIPQHVAFSTSQAVNTSIQQLRESYVDTLKGHNFWITDVKVASDNRHIATSSADGHVKIWDIRGRPSRNVIFQTKEEKPVWSLCWKPGAGATSFMTGSGLVQKSPLNASSIQSAGNVRWYQISGAAA